MERFDDKERHKLTEAISVLEADLDKFKKVMNIILTCI